MAAFRAVCARIRAVIMQKELYFGLVLAGVSVFVGAFVLADLAAAVLYCISFTVAP
jgi:hypothetical protein